MKQWLAVLKLLVLSTLGSSLTNDTSRLNAPIHATFIYEQGSQGIKVSKNHQITVIDIHDNMVCSMNIRVNSLLAGVSQNVFHIGDNKKDENYPSVFIDKESSNGFKIRISNTDTALSTLYTRTDVQVNTTYQLSIEYTQQSFHVYLNSSKIFSDSNFGQHSLAKDRTVFAGNPWHEAADALITDLQIFGWNDILTTESVDHDSSVVNGAETKVPMTWIVLSVFGVFLVIGLCILCVLNYRKISQCKQSCKAQPGPPQPMHLHKMKQMSTNDIIQYKIQRMKEEAGYKYSIGGSEGCTEDCPEEEVHYVEEFYPVDGLSQLSVISDEEESVPQT